MPDTVTVRDREGRAYDVSPDQLAGYQAQGFTEESPDQRGERIGADVRHDIYGGVGGTLATAGLGALSGVTLGASDVAAGALGFGHDVEALQQENPYTSLGANILGSLAPAVLSGGASEAGSTAGLGARILSKTPAGLVGHVGSAVGEGVVARTGGGLASKVLGGTVGAAAEGSLYGGGQYLSQVAIEDKPLTAEGFVGAMGKGALFAAPIGGAFTFAGETLTRARNLFPRSEMTPAAAREAQHEATSQLAQTITDGDSMAAQAAQKIALQDAQQGMAQSGERVTRTVFGQADPVALADQVGLGAEKQKLVDAVTEYGQAKAKFDDWLATEADPELEAALTGMRAPDTGEAGGRIGPDVPIAEFGAPGARGYDPGNVREPGPPSQAPLANAPEGTPVTRALRKPTAPGEPTTAFDFKDSGLTFDPETRSYLTKETGNAEPDLEALLGATKQGLDQGVPMRELSGKPGRPGGVDSVAPQVTSVGKRPTEVTAPEPAKPLTDDEFKEMKRVYGHAADSHMSSELFYSKGGDEIVNPELRSGKPLSERGQKLYDGLMEAYKLPESRLKRDVEVYRGLSDRSGTAIKDRFANIKPGDLLDDPAFMSTSYYAKGGSRGEEIVFLIHAPEGSPALPIRSQYGNEGELLFPPHSKLRVDSVETVPVGERWHLKRGQTKEQFAEEMGGMEIRPDGTTVLGSGKRMTSHAPLKEIRATLVDAPAPSVSAVRGPRVDLSAPIDRLSVRQLGEYQDVIDSMLGTATETEKADLYKKWDEAVARRNAISDKAARAPDKSYVMPGATMSKAAIDRGPVPEMAEPTDTLTGLLRGTKSKLDAGESLVEMGAPARAEYATAKAARTKEAAEHFRAKATAAQASTGSSDFRPIPEHDYIAHRKSFEEKLSPDERKAIDTYTSTTYKDINRALRHEEIRNGREGFISKIDEALAKSPLRDNAKLYRGLSGDEAKQFRSLEVGDTFEEKAFTSTSSSPDAFKREVNLHIDVPAGYEAAPVPSSIDEKEWLLRRNTRFEVTGIQDHGATRTINVRVVDSPPPRPVEEMASTKTGRLPDAPPVAIVKGARDASEGGDLMAALQGTKQGLDSGKGLREIAGHAPAEPAATDAAKALRSTHETAVGTPPRGVPTMPTMAPPADGVEGLRAAIAKLHSPGAMPVSAAEYGARKAEMGFQDRPFSVALKKRFGKNVDMSQSLSRAADAIGSVEAASAKLADALGAEAPATAVMRARGYYEATGRHADSHAASTAAAADGIGAKLKGDPTVIDPTIKERMSGVRMDRKLSGALDATQVDTEMAAKVRAAQREATTPASAAAPTPPTGAPSGSGILGKAADIGTAIEVMKALGVHTAGVSAIPVIGPVLSLFLKARAALAIIGRKGGSIPRSTESVIAAKAAAIQDRVTAATQELLESGIRKGKVVMPATAAILGYRLFPGGKEPEGKDAQSLYRARMDELARAGAPGAIEAAIGDHVNTSDPELKSAIVEQMNRGLKFLYDKAPKQTVMPGMVPGDGVWRPAKGALDEWAKYVHYVNDPASVLEELAKGQVTMEGAETLQRVYPELFGVAQRELVANARQMQKTLPYTTRAAISIMYRVPVDGTMTAQHLRFLAPAAPVAAAMAAGGAVGGGPQGAPAIAGPIKLGQQTMTPLDRRAGA